MMIETLTGRLAISHVTYASATAFPSRVPTVIKPSGDGVIDLGSDGAEVPTRLFLVPVATGTAAHTFSMRIIGWRKVHGDIQGGSPLMTLWIPIPLAEVVCTISSLTGVAGSVLDTTIKFINSITLTTGNANISVETLVEAGSLLGYAELDTKGSQLAEITFNMTSGDTAACLYARRTYP